MKLLLVLSVLLLYVVNNYSAECEKIGSSMANKMEILNSYFLSIGMPAFFEYDTQSNTICFNKQLNTLPTTKKELIKILNRI